MRSTQLEFGIETVKGTAPPQDQRAKWANLGFGTTCTDHMIQADWNRSEGWSGFRLRPFDMLQLSPTAQVFHNGQCVFEGFKAYRQDSGRIALFRVADNERRLRNSCRRIGLPELPEGAIVSAASLLVQTDAAWVPPQDLGTLYVRPFIFSTGAHIGAHPASSALLTVIACPVGSYFAGQPDAISVFVEERYVRAVPGGTGAAKFSGNYAGTMVPLANAENQGCEQVLFLDALEHEWFEELAGMNIYAVFSGNRLVTPPAVGTILEGITRSSIISLATKLGYQCEERRLSKLEIRESAATGELKELFACGTAATIAPIERLVWSTGDPTDLSRHGHEVAAALKHELIAIQQGRSDDVFGWMTYV